MTETLVVVSVEMKMGGHELALYRTGDRYSFKGAWTGKARKVHAGRPELVKNYLNMLDDMCNEGEASLVAIDDKEVAKVRAF
jgi:hypothetical protein